MFDGVPYSCCHLCPTYTRTVCVCFCLLHSSVHYIAVMVTWLKDRRRCNIAVQHCTLNTFTDWTAPNITGYYSLRAVPIMQLPAVSCHFSFHSPSYIPQHSQPMCSPQWYGPSFTPVYIVFFTIHHQSSYACSTVSVQGPFTLGFLWERLLVHWCCWQANEHLTDLSTRCSKADRLYFPTQPNRVKLSCAVGDGR